MTKHMTLLFTFMTITMITRLNSSDISSVNQLEVTPGVSLMWGIADTTAVVGRLFSYHIPSDAFSGPVAGYKVLEAGRPCLPSWLHFISHLNVLRGLPTPTDSGSVYLEVHAIDVLGNNASDVFSIRISPDIFPMSAGDCMSMPDAMGQNAKLPTVCCKREKPETMATMVISADLPILSAMDRLKLVERFLNHTRMEGHAVKVVPATTEILQDAAALITGSGDVDPWSSKLGSTSRVTAISWLVGCGKVEPKHLQLLQKLDDDASGGLMKNTLGHSVLGWHVTNSRLQEQQYYLKRKRRQIQPTPTPVPSFLSTTSEWQSSSEATTTTEVIESTSPIIYTTTATSTMDSKPSTVLSPTTAVLSPTTAVLSPTTAVLSPTTAVLSPTTAVLSPTTAVLSPATVSTTTSTTFTTSTTSTTSITIEVTTNPEKETDEMDICVKPTVLEEIGVIKMYANDYFASRIQDSVFDACGRGGTSHTVLHLFREKSWQLPADWFLKFDSEKQLIWGLPLESHIGNYQMTLEASLSDQAYFTTMKFTLSVLEPRMGPKHMPSHELLTTIDYDYNEFTSDVDNLLDLSRKMATVLGGGDVESLTVLRLAPGSVVYTFTNNTLSGPGCPVQDITMMADKLVSANGSLVQHAVEHVRPWILSAAAVRPSGDCVAVPHFPSRSTSAGPDGTKWSGVAVTADDSDNDDVVEVITSFHNATTKTNAPGSASAEQPDRGTGIWITTVVPVVVIVTVVLLALLIACLLYRKKRSGKMSLEDQNRFLGRGAPVIFPDELDDKPDCSRKPLINDVAASQPPAYNCNDSPAIMTHHPGLVLHGHHDTDVAMNDDIEMNVTSPLYRPPPPVTASNGKQARPLIQQSYRSRPPEIQP